MSVYGELQILQQTYLTAVVSEFLTDVKEFRGSAFCSLVDAPSHKVEWDELMGAAGMTPPVALGGESPMQVIPGARHRSFEPAYFREKSVLNEKDLLLLRKPGTWEESWAKGIIVRALSTLNTRLETRLEWLRWQMLAGSVSLNQNGVIFTVNYNVPNTPSAATVWSNAASDPLDDILSWENTYFRGTGAKPAQYWFNRKVKQYLLSNTKIRDLVKERYGFSLVTDEALQKVLGDFVCYDGGYTMLSTLNAAVSAGGSTLSVVDATGFSAGDRVTLYDGTTTEYATILSVSGNAITLTGGLTNAFAVGTQVSTFLPFIPDDKFIILGKGPVGEPHMDFITVPSLYQGIETPKPGKFVKTWDKGEEDPPSVEIVVGLYGLPRNFHPNWHVYADIA